MWRPGGSVVRDRAYAKWFEPKWFEPKWLEPKGLDPKGLEPKGLEPKWLRIDLFVAFPLTPSLLLLQEEGLARRAREARVPGPVPRRHEEAARRVAGGAAAGLQAREQPQDAAVHRAGVAQRCVGLHGHPAEEQPRGGDVRGIAAAPRRRPTHLAQVHQPLPDGGGGLVRRDLHLDLARAGCQHAEAHQAIPGRLPRIPRRRVLRPRLLPAPPAAEGRPLWTRVCTPVRRVRHPAAARAARGCGMTASGDGRVHETGMIVW